MDTDHQPTISNPLMVQTMFQALYHISKQRVESERASGAHSPTKETPEDIAKSPIAEPEPKCDAEETSTRLFGGESVDIESWRAEHLDLAKRYPKQHQDCPRILWKIVDFIELDELPQQPEKQPPTPPLSGPPSSANIVKLLMRDIYTLSENHDFVHTGSGRKLATLVGPVEAVSIHRELLDRDSGFDSENLVRLEASLGRMSNQLHTLRERIALNRQLLVLEPGRTTAIRRLAHLLAMLYDRTSEDTASYEAWALRDELARRSRKEECAVMDRIEAEWRENSAFQDVEIRVVEHISLVQASPATHAPCVGRLLTLVEDTQTSLGRNITSGDRLMLIREAVRLVDRGIGISEQLRALNALYCALQEEDLDRISLLAILGRIHSLVADTRHRVEALSWLGAGHRIPRRTSSQDYSTLAWDAMARLEAETIPGIQWVNPALLSFNEGHRKPDTMEDFQDQFRRAAFQTGNFDEMPENSPQRAHSLTMYAMTILGNNHPERANMVIEMLRDAVRAWGLPLDQPAPAGHPIRGTLQGLAHAYYMRHWWFGEARDIETAVNVLRYTMMGAVDKSDHMPIIGPLCAALEAKYRRLGEVKDIKDAFALINLFCDNLPKNVDTLQVVGFRQWAKAADCLFDALGDTTLLDYAARRARQALRLTSAKHPLLPVLLSLLGSILRKRFLCLQIPQDLVVSENFTLAAVRTQEDSGSIDQDLPNNRALYAETMMVKFGQDSNPRHLETALSTLKKVLDLGSEHDANRPDFHYRYGHALCLRNRDDDLATAMTYLRKALALQPDTRHTRYPLWATGLSNALVLDFRNTGDSATLQEAIKLSETATSLVSDTSTMRADVYAQLAEALFQRFQSGRDMNDLEACILAFESAALSVGAPLLRRLHCTRRWEDIAAMHNHPSLSRVLDISLRHQDKIVGLGKSVKSRHEYLAKNPSVASRAAAHAILQGNLELAVECLERGRSILWRQTLELRASLEQLKSASPSLADQLAAVVEELDESERLHTVSGPFAVTAMGIKDPDRLLQYQRELSEQYESLLTQIRQLDGFNDFLRPFAFADAAGIASDGPVIMLNLCDEGCDALVLLNSGVYHVPLPDADFNTLLAKRAALMVAATRVMYDEGAEMDAILPPLLRILWTSVVEPVVSFIQASGTTEKRVFWCVAGLSDLPIHAAGPYKAGQRGLQDTFVSSYTPTLSALIRARKAAVTLDTPQPRLLAVAQTETTGLSELPSALEEIETLEQMNIITTVLANNEAHPSSVLSELKTHNWVHFCCHGTTNADLPLLSAFHLAGSTLTIESLMRTELPLADFAFLSACHTAEVSAAQNENMSLASTLQVTGFRSIVATMYAIADSDGPTVAYELYQHMFRDENQPASSSDAALGLNKAVRKLRQSKTPMHRWVPFIHIGV